MLAAQAQDCKRRASILVAELAAAVDTRGHSPKMLRAIQRAGHFGSGIGIAPVEQRA